MVNEIKFGNISREADIRMLYDMEDVIYDQGWLKSADNTELYYMYRNLYRTENDLEIIEKNHLRYDITVIPSGLLGIEYIKTAGHYHPKVPGSDATYPEVYQVLEGNATYLLQKRKDENDDRMIEDVIITHAGPGDVVVVPPYYGHVTINESDSDLKMANWVCSDFSSVYDSIKKCRGAAYYLIKTGYVRNTEYMHIPDSRYISPKDLEEFGLIKGHDMYELVNDIEKLDFLRSPQNYTDIFERMY